MLIPQEVYSPPKIQEVIGSKKRYKILYGGRGSGKSYSFADGLITQAATSKVRILCTREQQNSIKDSVYKLLSDRIESLQFGHKFKILRDNILSDTGSEFLFKGLRHNITEIKSTEGIDICWVEEAEKVSQNSWDVLIPTIRKQGSQIWISFNPEEEKAPTYQRFIVNEPPDCAIAKVNYEDNRFFPDTLRREMEYDKRVDYEKYLHVWEGEVKKYGEACIFHNKIFVEEFETPDNSEFKFGADWGFSVDPTCLQRMFISNNVLYLDYEFYGHGVELSELHKAFSTVPGSRKWQIVADSQRPDTISFMRKEFVDKHGERWDGFNIVGAEKGKGSVEDGIEFLRGFEKIVIHPRCKGAIGDFTNYRWKRDRVTNEILPIPLDLSNHSPDAVRYALEKLMKAKDPNVRFV
jgi:phage terminase large subunit